MGFEFWILDFGNSGNNHGDDEVEFAFAIPDRDVYFYKKIQTMIVESVAKAPAKKQSPARKKAEKIPDYLVREVIDGIPFYYPGFREVMNKTKTIEEIMADSILQSLLKNFLGDLLKAHLDKKLFLVLAGETGSHVDRRNNMGLDVVVFDKTILTPDKITTKYSNVPPKIVVEIDVNVEVNDTGVDLFSDFVLRKVRRLFAFGTEKVVWIFSRSKLVMVAKPDAPLQILDWDQDVELLDGITCNIAKYLEEEGISLP